MAIYKGNTKIDGGYPISTEISSTSTDNEVASAKAVYDSILRPESATGTGTTGMDYDQTTFYKVGKVVMVIINFHITGSISTNGNIYTSIPYIPNVNSRGIIISTSGYAWCVNIRRDGTMQIMDRALSSGWYNGFGMYIEEDNSLATLNSLNTASLMNTGSLLGNTANLDVIDRENTTELAETNTEQEGSGDSL